MCLHDLFDGASEPQRGQVISRLDLDVHDQQYFVFEAFRPRPGVASRNPCARAVTTRQCRTL